MSWNEKKILQGTFGLSFLMNGCQAIDFSQFQIPFLTNISQTFFETLFPLKIQNFVQI